MAGSINYRKVIQGDFLRESPPVDDVFGRVILDVGILDRRGTQLTKHGLNECGGAFGVDVVEDSATRTFNMQQNNLNQLTQVWQ